MTAGQVAASTPSDDDWRAAVRLVAGEPGHRPDVTLLCHVSPDGDALGSALALGLALRRLGVPVRCSWDCIGGDERHTVPAPYRQLPGLDLIVPPSRVPAEPDVVVSLDAGSLDRLGGLAAAAKSARALLVVDHHVSNTRFGTHHLLDTGAAATAVIVADLVDRLGVELDADIAAGLYAGLTTDTGSFMYAVTTPQVHDFAARLLATGVRHDLIAREVWSTHPVGYLRLLGAALDRLRFEPDAVGGLGLVWTYTTTEELAAHSIAMEEIEGVIDVVRTAAEAEVAVVCKGDVDGSVKVSTRSKGRIDLGSICTGLGGGGHRFAAGFTSHDDPGTTIARLRPLLAAAPQLPA